MTPRDETDEAKRTLAVMEGLNVLIHRVTWLEILVIILLAINIAYFLVLLYR